MLFNFRLHPVEQIAPFGEPHNSTLHWFGLTDCCFWMQAGETELFRYRQAMVDEQQFVDDCGVYVNYYAARFWEDVLRMLSAILMPVPPILHEKIGYRTSADWVKRAGQWLWREDEGFERRDKIYTLATSWIWDRYLDTSYLKWKPSLWFWNDSTQIHIEWDNSRQIHEGIAVWEAQFGSWSLPIVRFIAEVRALDGGLIQQMGARIAQINANWTRPEIHIDIDRLNAEQAERGIWLATTLQQAINQTPKDWTPIIDAVACIEAEISIKQG